MKFNVIASTEVAVVPVGNVNDVVPESAIRFKVLVPVIVAS